jgi:hypothetical protein
LQKGRKETNKKERRCWARVVSSAAAGLPNQPVLASFDLIRLVSDYQKEENKHNFP